MNKERDWHMILEHITQTIAENTSEIIGFPIIITDDKGNIIGSSDRSRLGTLHKASLEVLKKNQDICYEIEDVKRFENVLPGVATPIFLNNKPIGVLGIVGIPNVVKKYVQLVKSYVEMMCHESFKKETIVLESKTLDTLVQFLLYSNNNEETDHIIRYGKMLGYNLDLDRICIIIEIDLLSIHLPSQEDKFNKFSFQYFQKELIEQVKYLFVDNKEDIISLLNLEQFIILKSVYSNDQDTFLKAIESKTQKLNQFLKKKHNLSAAIALGNIQNGFNGIKESYENAVRTLNIGKKNNILPKIYNYNDWDITLELLTSELTPYILDKLTNNLSALINHSNYATLSATFMAYCKCNMNLSETARSLFIHRNSLVYRLEKIAELSCLNLSKFEHCLLLFIAIKND
jgi:carbohydrate diacid regulator